MDRALSFSDSQIVQTLKTKFVTVAIDQWYHRQQADAEGDYYRKIATQAWSREHVANLKGATTQGLYVATAAGDLLGFVNRREPDQVKSLLKKALADFRPVETPPIENANRDSALDRALPDGTLVVRVTAKVLGGFSQKEPANPMDRAYRNSLGRDQMWITKDEAAALVRGHLPDTLKARIARFHLLDTTWTEMPPWSSSDDMRRVEMTLKDGRLEGSFHLETRAGDQGFQGELLGYFATADGKLTRFDVVARGLYWGTCRYNAYPSYPRGKFPFAVAFTLSATADEQDKVPPQATKRYWREYLGNGR